MANLFNQFIIKTISTTLDLHNLQNIFIYENEILIDRHFGNTLNMLYSRDTNISGNIIKHNLRTSMNERTHFYIKINLSHFILERVDVSVVCEMSGETYTQREDFFPYLLPGARRCQRLHSLARSSETPLIGCMSLARQRFSALCQNLTAWFSSRGLLPVTHLLYPSALIVMSSPCSLIKM